jgi:Arc/MetJ-type ribon-helix-helix transcriptional regulator
VSKGNPRITVRLPPDLSARIERQRESLRYRSPRPPHDLSDVIRTALEAWLAKYERSRRHRRPRTGSGRRRPAASAVSDTRNRRAAALEVA